MNLIIYGHFSTFFVLFHRIMLFVIIFVHFDLAESHVIFRITLFIIDLLVFL